MKPQIGFLALITLLATVLTPQPLNLPAPFSTPQALAQTPDSRKAQADQLLAQGIKQYETGNFEASRQTCQQALTIYQEIKDRLGEERSLIRLAIAYLYLDNPSKAMEYSQRSLAIAKEIKDHLGEGRSLSNLANAYRRLNNSNKAMEYYQQSLAISRQVKDREGEGTALAGIGRTYEQLDNYIKAIDFYKQSLEIDLEIGERKGQSYSLFHLGSVYEELGAYSKAVNYYQQSLAISRQFKDREGEGTALAGMGSIYEHQSDHIKAISFHLEALKIRREMGYRTEQVYSLESLGDVYYNLKDYDKAIEFYQESLKIAQALSEPENKVCVVCALNNLGEVYKKLNNYDKAIEFYQQSLNAAQAISDLSKQKMVLSNLSSTYFYLGNYSKAIEYYQQYLAIARRSHDLECETCALGELGAIYSYLEDSTKAIEYTQQALVISRKIKDRQWEVWSLNQLGEIYRNQGNYTKAIDYAKQALGIARKSKNHQREAQSLNQLGKTYENLDDYAKAIEYIQQALGISRKIKDRTAEVEYLNSLGDIYGDTDDYAKAIEYAQQGLQIAKEIEDHQGEADSLGSLGYAYQRLGESTKASEYYEQALTLSRKIHNPYEISVLGDLGFFRHSLALASQSLALARKFKNRYGEAAALNDLGLAYAGQGDFTKAIEHFEKSVAIYRKIHDRLGEGQALGNLGNTYRDLGNFAKAINYQQQSLAIKREVHNRIGEGIMLLNIGSTFLASGNLTAAEKYVALSMQSWESIRAKLGSNDANKISIFETYEGIYLSLQQILIAENKAKAALEIAERGRARAFVELLASRLSPPVAAAQSSITPPTAKLLQQIAKSHNSTIVEYSIMNGGFKVQGKEHWGESELFIWVIKPTGEAAFRRVELTPLWQQQNASLKELASNSPSVVPAVSNSPAVVTPAPQVEQELTMPWEHPDVIVFIIVIGISVIVMAVYYGRFLLTEKAAQREIANADNAGGVIPLIPTSWYKLKPHWLVQSLLLLLAAGSTGCLMFWMIQNQLSAQNSNLRITQKITQNRHLKNDSLVAQLVSSTHESIGTNRGLGIVPKGQKTSSDERLKQLSSYLIQPIADLLPTDPNAHIIFIPHKSLFLVPFPALQDADGKSLIEKHTILTAPSIQALNLTHQERQRVRAIYKLPLQGKDALIVGNPTMPYVPPEIKISEPPQQLPSLPGAEEEAKSIAALLKTQAITGNEATKQAILQKMSGARIVHLATHGILDEMRGLGSAIALAPNPNYQGKRGEVNGLLTAEEILNLKLNAELVVLSACDTGRGRITGDGVVGLSRSLISAGVPSVIVSLWSVPDAPTAFLMTEFYRNLQKNPDKAQALRQAMLTTMKQHPNPIDWAAFTLIGEAE